MLLRGVNLGPRNRVGMTELRAQLHADGFEQVSTYLQSGNVVLTNDASASKLAAHFRGLLRERFKLDVEVVVRTRRRPRNCAASSVGDASFVSNTLPLCR